MHDSAPLIQLSKQRHHDFLAAPARAHAEKAVEHATTSLIHDWANKAYSNSAKLSTRTAPMDLLNFRPTELTTPSSSSPKRPNSRR
ncbi:hypothetical protein CSING_06340 [Corynebacterium singulare]|uniref:Uncharacterized protein n=1 Tax=Corynebacterium singulare TaxID=161899 RepID=A0A0B6F437_9CORY|nr:hypothetical protein CSING_06340 [Corynebacterium singulare]